MLLSLLFWILSPSPTVDEHAIYISIVEINYNSTATSNLSVKVFSDDLQDALRNFSSDYVPGPLDSFIRSNEKLVEGYFKQNLSVEANGEMLSFQFLNAKQESDAHFLTFKLGTSNETLKELKVDGKFFMEIFPDQSNVINLRVADKKYFARLTKSDPTYSFTLN